MTIYEGDAEPASDSGFEPGVLAHLVVGNRGRLLDARRTPIVLTGLDFERGMFELELRAFEDVGNRWQLPFEDVSRFQFELGSAREEPAPFQARVDRFDRELRIDCDSGARARTERRIAQRSQEFRGRLGGRWAGVIKAADRDGDPVLFEAVESEMQALGLAELEREFAETFVSNPSSGEVVKGHAIVAAELGLCPYQGKIVRSPDLFAGAWSRDRRAEHLVSRLAFVRAIFELARLDQVVLYRGMASERGVTTMAPSSFVSATFSSDVAESHFAGGPNTVAAALFRQRVPIERLFMTYLETRAMNARYREAEAILLGQPENAAF